MLLRKITVLIVIFSLSLSFFPVESSANNSDLPIGNETAREEYEKGYNANPFTSPRSFWERTLTEQNGVITAIIGFFAAVAVNHMINQLRQIRIVQSQIEVALSQELVRDPERDRYIKDVENSLSTKMREEIYSLGSKIDLNTLPPERAEQVRNGLTKLDALAKEHEKIYLKAFLELEKKFNLKPGSLTTLVPRANSIFFTAVEAQLNLLDTVNQISNSIDLSTIDLTPEQKGKILIELAQISDTTLKKNGLLPLEDNAYRDTVIKIENELDLTNRPLSAFVKNTDGLRKLKVDYGVDFELFLHSCRFTLEQRVKVKDFLKSLPSKTDSDESDLNKALTNLKNEASLNDDQETKLRDFISTNKETLTTVLSYRELYIFNPIQNRYEKSELQSLPEESRNKIIDSIEKKVSGLSDDALPSNSEMRKFLTELEGELNLDKPILSNRIPETSDHFRFEVTSENSFVSSEAYFESLENAIKEASKVIAKDKFFKIKMPIASTRLSSLKVTSEQRANNILSSTWNTIISLLPKRILQLENLHRLRGLPLGLPTYSHFRSLGSFDPRKYLPGRPQSPNKIGVLSRKIMITVLSPAIIYLTTSGVSLFHQSNIDREKSAYHIANRDEAQLQVQPFPAVLPDEHPKSSDKYQQEEKDTAPKRFVGDEIPRTEDPPAKEPQANNTTGRATEALEGKCEQAAIKLTTLQQNKI